MNSNRLEWIQRECGRVDEQFNLNMTVAEFISVVKDRQLSNDYIRMALGKLGETLSKNSISNIYVAAGFEVKDARKKLIEPTPEADYRMKLKEAIPLARALRLKNEKTGNPKPQTKGPIKPKAIVIDPVSEPPQEQVPTQFAGRIQSNPFPLEQAAEATDFILAALNLTRSELESIRNLIYSQNESNSNLIESESIYDAIKQLGGRNRTNKTYYISKEIIDLVAEFAEDKSVKVSQFVEIALLDALKKYQ